MKHLKDIVSYNLKHVSEKEIHNFENELKTSFQPSKTSILNESKIPVWKYEEYWEEYNKYYIKTNLFNILWNDWESWLFCIKNDYVKKNKEDKESMIFINVFYLNEGKIDCLFRWEDKLK